MNDLAAALDFDDTMPPPPIELRHVRRRSSDRDGSAAREREAGPGQRLLTSGTLKGEPVINLHDQTLGHVEELLLDVEHGRIAYAVMAAGGFMGLGERLYAIPWAAVRPDPDRQCLVVDADKDRFAKAPGFDRKHWPSMGRREWHEEIHRHYAARPYWD